MNRRGFLGSFVLVALFFGMVLLFLNREGDSPKQPGLTLDSKPELNNSSNSIIKEPTAPSLVKEHSTNNTVDDVSVKTNSESKGKEEEEEMIPFQKINQFKRQALHQTKNFPPQLDEDWLIEMQEIYNRERIDAITLAKAMNMPFEDPNLFLRGVQNNRLLYYQTQNLNAAISTGANLVRNITPYLVNGTGVTMGVWDAGSVMPTHQEFGLRVSVKDGAFPHYHSTHVGGTIGGNGSHASALGMAPQVLIDSYEWNNDITEMGARGARYPGDSGRIQISNHSYGVISGWEYNFFSGNLAWHWLDSISVLTESFFGQYNSEAASYDQVAFNDPYYLIVKSAGNDRSDGPSNGNTFYAWNGSGWTPYSYNNTIHPLGDGIYKNGYDTIPTAGNAKNILTIGAVNDAVTSGIRDITKATMSTFSGWGPTDDGRIKPDVVGNGIGLFSADSASIASYTSLSGTSMSGPNVAGSLVLLQEYFDKKFPGHMLRSSSLKALIIATADDIGPSGPDFRNGWGLVNIKKAIDLIQDYATNPGNNMVIESKLITSTNTSDQFIYECDGLNPLIATIAWTDPKGTATSHTDSTAVILVNNLNLKVTAPDGSTVYYPYQLDRANPANIATTGINNVDNVEQVRITVPVAGMYTVQVDFSDALSGGSQYYSLIMQGVKKNVVDGLPVPISYVLGVDNGSQQEITINGLNFQLGANINLIKSGFADIVVSNKQVTPESIKGFIPSNSFSASNREIRITNADGQVGSNFAKPKSQINNLTNGAILTGNSFTITGTTSTLGEAISSVKVIIDDTNEFQAVNTGIDFSTWSYTWNLVTEAGTISHHIKTIAFTANYEEQTPLILSNITIDKIAPGVIINTNANTTSEIGGNATVSFRLQKKPTSDVIFSFATSNPGEAILSTSSITFTALNWFVTQSISVTGVDDLIDDDDVPYDFIILPLSSSDLAYHLMDPSDINFTNLDNDTAGVVITGTNLIVTETLINTQFELRLNSKPNSDVMINISSSDTNEGIVSIASVIFTPLNWMDNVSISLNGVDDGLLDGDIDFQITFPSVSSSDLKYNAISVTSINAKCFDDENSSLIISTSSPFTFEGGTSATLSFTLQSPPTATVTYPITFNGTSQVLLSANSISFNASNWNQPINVMVTAINDDLSEDSELVLFNFEPAVTTDLHYQGNSNSISLTVIDNDTPGLLISSPSGNINENGNTAYFNISLQSKPILDVVISLISSDTTEATLSVSSVTFTAVNWNIPRKVTIIPIDDNDFDGDIGFTINGTISTSDAKYQTIVFNPINLSSIDDEIPSILVTMNNSTTTENGGIATARIRLKIAPTADVFVPVSISNTAEGSVSPDSLIFTDLNWETEQVVSIIGIDDTLEDGNVNFYLITGASTSSDNTYTGLSGPNKIITNIDDDDLTPPMISLNGNAEMTTRLGNIFIDPLATAFDAKEGNLSNQIQISGAVNSNQISDYFIFYSVSDSRGNLSSTISRKVSVVNSAGLNVSGNDFLIKEKDGFDSISLSLKDSPNSPVVIDISIEGTGITITPSRFTFNSQSWNQNQTIKILSIDDNTVSEISGKIKISINQALSEINYANVSAISLNYKLIEDDENGFDLSVKSLKLLENEGAGEISVSLRAKPKDTVFIKILNPAIDRFKIDTEKLVFTNTDWNVKQKFKITSIDNHSPKINSDFVAIISIGSESDVEYLQLDSSQLAKAVSLLQENEDKVGLSINNKKLLVGPDLNDSFKVKLTAQPQDKVIIALSSNNVDLNISPNLIEFDSQTWSIEQTITIAGESATNTSANIDLLIDSSSDLDFLFLPKETVTASIIALSEDLIAINAESTKGGKISPSGSFVVLKSDLVSFEVIPFEGYELEKFLVNGVENGVKNQYSFNPSKETQVKVIFIRKILVPVSESKKPLPSPEQLAAFALLKQMTSEELATESNIELSMNLSLLKLSDTEKFDLLIILKNQIEINSSLKELDLPLVALLNLQKSLSTDTSKSVVVSVVENLLKNPNITSEQSAQLLNIINIIFINSSNDLIITNKNSISSILNKINHIQLLEFKNSGLSKNEIISEKIKILFEMIENVSSKNKSFAKNFGASEIEIPDSVLSLLRAQGHSVIYFNEVFSPYEANVFLDQSEIPISPITRIELLDAELSQIEVNNLMESITIKIPLSSAILNNIFGNDSIQPMFYNTATNKWSTVGITAIEQSTEFIKFQVNHLTEFALFRLVEPEVLPVDNSLVLNPSPAEENSGGGGGCTYAPTTTLQWIDIFYLWLYFLFICYHFRKRKL